MVLTLSISFLLISLIGVLLHYTHGIVKKGILLHIFSAINESTWEHTKLSFYPVLLGLIVHMFLPPFTNYEYFWGAGLLVLLLSILGIPLLYYPVRYILGREITAVSIGVYFIDIFLCMLLEYYLVSTQFSLISPEYGILGTVILIILYGIYTYSPPRNFLFRDPIFKKFGEFVQPFDKKPPKVK